MRRRVIVALFALMLALPVSGRERFIRGGFRVEGFGLSYGRGSYGRYYQGSLYLRVKNPYEDLMMKCHAVGGYTQELRLLRKADDRLDDSKRARQSGKEAKARAKEQAAADFFERAEPEYAGLDGACWFVFTTDQYGYRTASVDLFDRDGSYTCTVNISRRVSGSRVEGEAIVISEEDISGCRDSFFGDSPSPTVERLRARAERMRETPAMSYPSRRQFDACAHEDRMRTRAPDYRNPGCRR